ncbi:MAG: hypothetical protein JRF33_26390 [Deltaproteobacteria bacterium]|nr:hypothetical protein [Deltaproteobacteria bacterium]
MTEIVAIAAMAVTIIVGLIAHVSMVKMHRDMIETHHQLIELSNADRIRLLDRIKAKRISDELDPEPKTKTPHRPFAGEGNRRLQPARADN